LRWRDWPLSVDDAAKEAVAPPDLKPLAHATPIDGERIEYRFTIVLCIEADHAENLIRVIEKPTLVLHGDSFR
jgi:hypothetical protein